MHQGEKLQLDRDDDDDDDDTDDDLRDDGNERLAESDDANASCRGSGCPRMTGWSPSMWARAKNARFVSSL